MSGADARDPRPAPDTDPRIGMQVCHRRYVPRSHAHYGGELLDGAYVLGLFGDAATELCMRTDADEGLFAGYRDVTFLAPVRAGDVLEVWVRLERLGRRSREVSCRAEICCRADPSAGPSAAVVLAEPVLAVTATGTLVVPGPGGPPGAGSPTDGETACPAG